jgi:DnaJ-class molecular chaperone
MDLRVPFFCTRQTADAGGDHPVKYSRCVDSARKPTTTVVSFPPGIPDGQEVRVKGLGDEANGKLGDLIVIVRIKG